MTQKEKEPIAKAPERRVRRLPVGQRQPLNVIGKDPNYVYRFVNDTGARVAQFLDAGYEIEEASTVRIGDKRINTPTAEGTKAVAHVGLGDKAFLMKIPKEWYEEDQALKQAEVARSEEAMREKALDGTYGELKMSRD